MYKVHERMTGLIEAEFDTLEEAKAFIIEEMLDASIYLPTSGRFIGFDGSQH